MKLHRNTKSRGLPAPIKKTQHKHEVADSGMDTTSHPEKLCASAWWFVPVETYKDDHFFLSFKLNCITVAADNCGKQNESEKAERRRPWKSCWPLNIRVRKSTISFANLVSGLVFH